MTSTRGYEQNGMMLLSVFAKRLRLGMKHLAHLNNHFSISFALRRKQCIKTSC